VKYKWYRAEGKLTRSWIPSTIDFGFWIGAKNEKQARKRIEKAHKGKRHSFVIQGDKLVKLKGLRKNRSLGVVIAIHEDTLPKVWEASDWHKSWSKRIGRRIDVMWSSGKISKNFAENALTIIASDEISAEELDVLNIVMTHDMIENGLKPVDIAILGQEDEYNEEIELYKTYGGD
jgi:hypothetical protein